MSRMAEVPATSDAQSMTIEEVARQVGTPFFVYDSSAALRAYRAFETALTKWGAFKIAYSVKTNPLARLLSDLRDAGSWAEVTSPWEFEQALEAGFEPSEIIFNGPLKGAGIPQAAAHCASIQIDSLDELSLIHRLAVSTKQTIAIGLRLCPPQFGGSWSRFGLSVEAGEFDEALRFVQSSSSLRLTSCHFHLRTQVDSIDEYVEMALRVQDFRSERDALQHTWLDIGGGFPYDHRLDQEDQEFRPAELVQRLLDAWGDAPRPMLVVEPGRWIAAPCLSAVGQAIAVKRRPGEPTIVVLDMGTNQNVMAAFYEHQWTFFGEVADIGPFRLCGPLCMEDDILSGAMDGHAPVVESLVRASNAGAYSIALARNFIQPIAPVIQFQGGALQVLSQRGIGHVKSNANDPVK